MCESNSQFVLRQLEAIPIPLAPVVQDVDVESFYEWAGSAQTVAELPNTTDLVVLMVDLLDDEVYPALLAKVLCMLLMSDMGVLAQERDDWLRSQIRASICYKDPWLDPPDSLRFYLAAATLLLSPLISKATFCVDDVYEWCRVIEVLSRSYNSYLREAFPQELQYYLP